jgi:hypothetical protein
MPPHVREALGRDPREDRNPLDMASFYIEELKYGPSPEKVVSVSTDDVQVQLEGLLRDADVATMTGEELIRALEYYARSLSITFRVPLILSRSLLLDGMMHGIALAGGLSAEPRPEEDDG